MKTYLVLEALYALSHALPHHSPNLDKLYIQMNIEGQDLIDTGAHKAVDVLHNIRCNLDTESQTEIDLLLKDIRQASNLKNEITGRNESLESTLLGPILNTKDSIMSLPQLMARVDNTSKKGRQIVVPHRQLLDVIINSLLTAAIPDIDGVYYITTELQTKFGTPVRVSIVISGVEKTKESTTTEQEDSSSGTDTHAEEHNAHNVRHTENENEVNEEEEASHPNSKKAATMKRQEDFDEGKTLHHNIFQVRSQNGTSKEKDVSEGGKKMAFLRLFYVLNRALNRILDKLTSQQKLEASKAFKNWTETARLGYQVDQNKTTHIVGKRDILRTPVNSTEPQVSQKTSEYTERSPDTTLPFFTSMFPWFRFRENFQATSNEKR